MFFTFLQRGVRDSSIKSDEPERLRKEGSQQNSAIISGMESSGFDKYPEIGMYYNALIIFRDNVDNVKKNYFLFFLSLPKDHFLDQNSSMGGSMDMNIDLLGQLRR